MKKISHLLSLSLESFNKYVWSVVLIESIRSRDLMIWRWESWAWSWTTMMSWSQSVTSLVNDFYLDRQVTPTRMLWSRWSSDVKSRRCSDLWASVIKCAALLIHYKNLNLRIQITATDRTRHFNNSRKVAALDDLIIKIEYEIIMIESCAKKRRKERNKSRDQVWSIWRSSMKDIEEETMSFELIHRSSLIEEDIFSDVFARIRNAFNLRSAFFFWHDFSLHSRAQVSFSFISFSDYFALVWYDDDDQLEYDWFLSIFSYDSIDWQ